MSQLKFTVISTLLYPFSTLLATAAPAYYLSQFPAYRDLLRKRESANFGRDGLIAGLVLCFISLLNFRPLPHFATVFGFLAGMRASVVAGILFGFCMVLSGWPLGCVVACGLAGPLGALLRRFKKLGRSFTVVSAGIWVPLGWKLGWVPQVFLDHTSPLPAHQMPWLLAGLSGISCLQSWLLLRLLEYIAQLEARRNGEMLWKTASLLDSILVALRCPLPNRRLCQAVGSATEAECLALGADGCLLSEEPHFRLAADRATTKEILSLREPEVRQTGALLSVENSIGRKNRATVIIPLHDGECSFGALLLPVSPHHPLAGPEPAMRRAVSALLVGELTGQRLLRQQALLEETRYRMLAAQIQPHFLFNSLTAVAALTLTQPAEAHDLMVDLAHSLRPRFTQAGSWTTLRDEVSTLRTYLSVEKARFGKKLQIAYSIPEELLDCVVPPMLLQPLVENAVRHGFAELDGVGLVQIKVEIEGEFLRFEVHDNGRGFDSRTTCSGHGVGLSNVKERLHTIVGSDCDFQIRSIGEEGTIVSYRVSRLRTAPPERNPLSLL